MSVGLPLGLWHLRYMQNAWVAVADRTALIAALATHRADELLGTPEGPWVEFKQSPWPLNNDRSKWEFAKDVAAMAKGGGGLIVVGVATSRQPHDTHELASATHPFEQTIVNIDTMKAVLRTWIVPPQRPSLTWFESSPGSGKYFLVLDVPALPDRDGYAVLRRTVTDGGKTVDAVAVPIRYGDETEWLSAERIQQLLRDGHTDRTTPGVPAPTTEDIGEIRRRADEALNDLESAQGWEDKPVLYWQSYVAPQPPTLPGLYAPDGVLGYLDQPANSLRPQGFRFHNPYRRVDVTSNGISYPTRKGLAVEVRSDGTATGGVVADRSLLARSNGVGPNLPVSSIVLTELTFEYFRLVDEHIMPRAQGAWFHRVVTRRFRDNHVTLAPGSPGNVFNDGVPANGDLDKEFLSTGSLASDAGTALAVVYGSFGLDASANPWVSDGAVDIGHFLSDVGYA